MNVGTVQEPSLVQNARMICNDRGRCFETRGRVHRDYDEDYVAPRRSYEYRGPYSDYDEGPEGGIALWLRRSLAITAGNSQAREPAPPGWFFLRRPLLNEPVMPPGNHFVQEVWPRGHSAGSAIQIAGRKGGDLTLCLPRTGKTPRRGYRAASFSITCNHPGCARAMAPVSPVRMRA